MKVKNNLLHLLCRGLGIFNLAVGIGAILFFTLGPYLFKGLLKADWFSPVFINLLAQPALMLVIGIVLLRPRRTGLMLSFFISIFLFFSLFAALMDKEPPFFLDQEAQTELIFLCHNLLPVAGSLFFGLQALVCLLGARQSQDVSPAPTPGVLEAPEIFCGNCQASLKPTDTICPNCKAVIKGLQCPGCGFEGDQASFPHNTCPRCGRQFGTEESSQAEDTN